MVETFVSFLIIVLVVGLIAGVSIFIIRRAPFIPAEFKQLAEWIILVAALIFLLLKGLPLLGVSI